MMPAEPTLIQTNNFQQHAELLNGTVDPKSFKEMTAQDDNVVMVLVNKTQEFSAVFRDSSHKPRIFHFHFVLPFSFNYQLKICGLLPNGLPIRQTISTT